MIDKTSCDRDDRYSSRNECMESRLNRPYRLTKNSVTETITQKQSLRTILRIVEAKGYLVKITITVTVIMAIAIAIAIQ